MDQRYVKLALIVPHKAAKGKKLQHLVKKMPVVANFKPQSIEMRVLPSENGIYSLVEVFIT